MNYSQGFIDGYEGNEYEYDYVGSSSQYFTDYHKGKNYREVHLRIFENHNCCYDLKADEFQMRNTQAIALMNEW